MKATVFSLLVLVSLLPAQAIELSAASFTVSFAADGRPDTCRRRTDGVELLRTRNAGLGFYLKAPDTAPVRLAKLSLRPDGRLSARSEDGAKEILFRVTRGQRHLALRIEQVEGVRPERLESLHFEMNAKSSLRVLDLDYMTRVENRPDGVRVEWREIWRRSPQNPLGGFAIYEKTGDDDEDATLLRLWVDEKLPHPKLDGEWTVERARRWMNDWQRRFADRSQMILAGRSIAELHEGVEFARRAGIRQIYLFTDTWRTDPFWPSTDLNWAVNRVVFPRGETDLREFAEFVRGQGMYLALHYVSGGIGLRDPLYIGRKPDRRLASWGGGRLAGDVGTADTTLVVQPAPGVVPPAQHRPAYPHFFEWNMLRVGDELVKVGAIEPGADGIWKLTRCQRGQGSTTPAAHVRGEDSVGLLVAYGQNFVPDNDSTLLGEIAQNYAGLLNRCLVDHAEFDGAEIHRHDGDWGYDKFATRVYEELDHPTTSHDSSGRRPAAWFEYRLNSSRRLMLGSCAYSHGNYSVPVTLATPSRSATTLLDAHFTLSQGNLGGALGICKPEPMFGVTPQVLKAHGLTGQFLEALAAWNEVNMLLTDAQRERINATFTRSQGTASKFNHHLCSPVVPVARKVDGHYEIVPTRVLTRKTGDILWQHGQEHGAISPRQYVKPGEELSLENPFAAQPAKFIVRVLWAFDPQGRTETLTKTSGKPAPAIRDMDSFTSGNDRHAATRAGSVPNLLLQPTLSDLRTAADTSLKTSVATVGNTVHLQAENPGVSGLWTDVKTLPEWRAIMDLTSRRGIGMRVTGDGSGAVLVFAISGRDYVVPIDFQGTRDIEIPNGEVSWASGYWGWRMETKHTDYASQRSCRLGFGYLPPKCKATVTVENITALAEIPAELENPLIRTGAGTLMVKGTVGSGQYLQYDNGETATVYDENWVKLRELPVEKKDYVMPQGLAPVSIGTTGTKVRPWLEVQFITEDAPMFVPPR